MKNRRKKLRKITVDGQEYKYLIENKLYAEPRLEVHIWKNKVSFLVKEFPEQEITPSFIAKLIEEKNVYKCTCSSGYAANACNIDCDFKRSL